jgi:hypothetical protein
MRLLIASKRDQAPVPQATRVRARGLALVWVSRRSEVSRAMVIFSDLGYHDLALHDSDTGVSGQLATSLR